MTEWLPYIFIDLVLLSLWVRKDSRIWGPLLGISALTALISGQLLWIGALILATWTCLWIAYRERRGSLLWVGGITVFGLAILLHLLPGFGKICLTEKFTFQYGGAFVGLLPLALFVPLSHTRKEWTQALTRGLWLTLGGIAVMTLLATAGGSVAWHVKLPAFAWIRYPYCLAGAAIEEGFYRGFLQTELCRRFGTAAGLIATSLIFAGSHIFWCPSLDIMAFVFLAGLLYGGVYLISKRIESSILCHFLLNFVHMTFFTYHAM